MFASLSNNIEDSLGSYNVQCTTPCSTCSRKAAGLDIDQVGKELLSKNNSHDFANNTFVAQHTSCGSLVRAT